MISVKYLTYLKYALLTDNIFLFQRLVTKQQQFQYNVQIRIPAYLPFPSVLEYQ